VSPVWAVKLTIDYGCVVVGGGDGLVGIGSVDGPQSSKKPTDAKMHNPNTKTLMILISPPVE
jgi:hypothetical protein